MIKKKNVWAYWSRTIGHGIMSSLVLNLASEASVRGMVAPDGSHRFSVYDFITMACQKVDAGAYARKTYSNLVKDGSEFKEEIEKSVHYIHFHGGRGAATPTMTLRGLQRLLLILGTKVAAEFRALLEGTFTRVMAGDTSLIKVIEANAASDAPIQQAYRQALEQEPVQQPIDMAKKRKADALLEVEIGERRVACMEKHIACVERFAGLMDSLNPEWKKDVELCRRVQDNLECSLLQSSGEVERSTPRAPKKKELYFPKLISSYWDNQKPAVHRFMQLQKGSNAIMQEPNTAMPQLKVKMADGLDPVDYPPKADLKHRVFGFCYKGPALTEYDLERTPYIKEAYGVELDGLHYVCIVCFRHASRRISTISTMLYSIGLLSCSAIPQLVNDHHISVYKPYLTTGDPILEKLKRPSASKWKWHSSLFVDEWAQ